MSIIYQFKNYDFYKSDWKVKYLLEHLIQRQGKRVFIIMEETKISFGSY
jgi:hypothetical protein